MQLFTVLSILLAASPMSLAAPTSYNQLQPSDRALVDATALICGQYPARSWVLIGTLKVDCPESVGSKEKRGDAETSVDQAWQSEYKVS